MYMNVNVQQRLNVGADDVPIFFGEVGPDSFHSNS